MNNADDFMGLVEKLADFIIVLDSERNLLYANSQVVEISGYDASELVMPGGMGIFNIGTLERICSVCQLSTGNSQYTTCFDSFMMTKAFGDVPVEVNASAVVWGGNQAAAAVIRGLSRRRALEESFRQVMLKQSAKITALSEELKEKDQDLDELRKNRDLLSLELLETNEAVTVLAKNIEKSRKEGERMLGKRISSRIMPIILELKNGAGKKKMSLEVDALENYLLDLTSTLLSGSEPLKELSSAEMRVASMIRNGAKTDEIARQLCISAHTVKTHRKNIRKKIKLQNSKVNLATYLKSKM